MPREPVKPTRITRSKDMFEIAKDRAKSRLKARGLAANTIDLDRMQTEISREAGKEIPEMVMIDATIEKMITQSLRDSRWAHAMEECTEKPTKSADTSAENIAVPILKEPASSKAPGSTGATNVALNSGEACKATYPPELLAVVEAEERRAAQKIAHIKICSTAINSVELSLSPLSTGEHKNFVDSIKVYLRAAIAQFVYSGPGVQQIQPSPPSLPSRPVPPILTVPHQRTFHHIAAQNTATENTWATVAQKGLNLSANQSITKMAEAALTHTPSKNTHKSLSDDRLFLRLDENHIWRQLSPSGIREAIIKTTICSPTDIERIHRTRTGFAISVKNQEAKARLLAASDTLIPFEAKLELPSDLVALRIASVPVAVHTLSGRVVVTPDMVATEILRVTKCTPSRVRVHGISKNGSLYRSWLALFPKASSPKPGFRLFDDSGIALTHQPRVPIQQCKRCLGFHATRGCSRTPACWNCASTMHSSTECKAATRCRNCGGPHRSDSRDCLARPSRSGPVTKEQLITIRQASQREYHAVARARAATIRAEVAAAKAKENTNISALATTDAATGDLEMTGISNFGVLNSEEPL